MLKTFAIALVLPFVACGADTTDIGPLPADDPSLRFALAGSIQIIESWSDGAGEVTGSWVYADLKDKVTPLTYAAQAEAGACKVWTSANSACDPQCVEGETCAADATCVQEANPTSAGDLTISGLVVSPITATAGAFGYVFSPEAPSDGLFDAGDAITITAKGDAAGLPAFSAAVKGVADFGLQGIGLVELVDGKDASISWTPAGDDSFVELVLQLGWHGLPPTGIIVCRAPDSAGTLVVPAAVIAKFPYFGGGGLFQNPSWAERVSRTLVATPAGPIEITASSRANVGVSHSEN